MWLITNFGFFSVVEKPGQKEKGTLTIRSRVKADLETLREKYLKSMGPVEADKGTDYKYRATAPAAKVAAAFCKAIADIDYSNFKDSVAAQQGSKRSHLYHEIWDTLWKLSDADQVASAEKTKPATARTRSSTSGLLPSAYGGVVFDHQGRVLLRKPAGEFDNYVWTFPKGRPDKGESPEAAAVREVRKETGVEAEIVGAIEGGFKGGTSVTTYYRMKLVKDHTDFDRAETDQVIWATPQEALKLIAETRNEVGRKRDLEVLQAATSSTGGGPGKR